jgi:hypothetical protein
VHERVEPARLQQRENEYKAVSGNSGTRATGITGEYSGLRDAPEVKSITYGSKEIRLTPEGLYIITEDSVIALTDAGILIQSENNITINSDKNIAVRAANDISVVGVAGVTLKCGENTGVILNNNVQVVGAVVRSN